ncbi:MAG: adenosylhomocysteinase [candidate division WOR-3 bacterium]
MKFHIKDINLSALGRTRVEWAGRFMPVLKLIGERFEKEKPFKNIKISACLHITTETANLLIVLKKGGAIIRVCASNPLSTQDDVAAYLVKEMEIPVFAIKREDKKTYYFHIHQVLEQKPNITIDDGADLVSTLHKERKDLIDEVIGGTEETTTGVIRLKNMEREGVLKYPIIAVNDSYTKYLFDNRYGTGQSTIDGILRATNFLFSSSTVVICGYGWCGRGIAMRAKGMGAQVIICEVDPIKALEAKMDGYEVMSLVEASRIGDLFITATGNINVINKKHFLLMKDGAILCNAGHFDVEIDKKGLKEVSIKKRKIREFCEEYLLKNKRRIYLLAEGRLVNLSSAEGHPAVVMDMSFANQALACEYLVKNRNKLENKVYKLPLEIDKEIAYLKLKSMGIKIDRLTKEQEKYLISWQLGT